MTTETESTLSTFVASDGDNIAIQDWPLEPRTPLRGVVVLVHGLGEHAGRYDTLARLLNDWGFAVRGYDQYGHGESGGPRGGLPTDTRLLEDLADIVDSTRARMDPKTPLILLGHSMGGLVAARFVALAIRPVAALILSSPALDPGLNVVQKLLVAVLPKIAPNLRVGNGLDASLISHDPAVVAAYQKDPLVHDRVSARLARFIADGGAATLALAPTWKVPTLLLYAGADKLVNPAGSRAFAAAAPKQVLTSRCFETLYHEIFNELQPVPVFTELKRWLDARF
ncbi:alpha/beta hydrolase [Rhodoferax sp. UBA5149]|uniref:alpha/beta hydrolase n=1 Tax=Rhodoferax sp. UBA5149 TaxID=1947379 RepID=UPI0025ECEA7B|nr:alpha/beta hydrolase [Rhodoferax sp. UBA5149]